jgi:hypothetical protein
MIALIIIIIAIGVFVGIGMSRFSFRPKHPLAFIIAIGIAFLLLHFGVTP